MSNHSNNGSGKEEDLTSSNGSGKEEDLTSSNRSGDKKWIDNRESRKDARKEKQKVWKVKGSKDLNSAIIGDLYSQLQAQKDVTKEVKSDLPKKKSKEEIDEEKLRVKREDSIKMQDRFKVLKEAMKPRIIEFPRIGEPMNYFPKSTREYYWARVWWHNLFYIMFKLVLFITYFYMLFHLEKEEGWSIPTFEHFKYYTLFSAFILIWIWFLTRGTPDPNLIKVSYIFDYDDTEANLIIDGRPDDVRNLDWIHAPFNVTAVIETSHGYKGNVQITRDTTWKRFLRSIGWKFSERISVKISCELYAQLTHSARLFVFSPTNYAETYERMMRAATTQSTINFNRFYNLSETVPRDGVCDPALIPDTVLVAYYAYVAYCQDRRGLLPF